MLTAEMFERAAAVEKLGIKAADAVHVAAAEEAGAQVLLSCDDRFCRAAQYQAGSLRVPVRNPLDWFKEMEDAADSG